MIVDKVNKIVYRNPAIATSNRHVAVISGGGSGHEPGFSGFVGSGLLSACICGTIFASPSADQIRKCLLYRVPANSEGILVVVMNYTGDVLNFGVGIEKARAMGKRVAMLVVGDDVGVGRAKSGKVGRRGLSGTALVAKVCGALAEIGGNLAECMKVGDLVKENVVSLGASLSRVHVPGRPFDETSDEEKRLGPGLVEIGMGIHNEPGCEKINANLPKVIEIMLVQLLDSSDEDRAYVPFGRSDKTVLLVNNFGGVSNLELGAIVTEVTMQLKQKYGLHPCRIYVGTLVGSLNGPGFSLSLLNVKDTGLGPGKSILELLDAPTEAAGWPSNIRTETWEKRCETAQDEIPEGEQQIEPSNLKSRAGNYLEKVNIYAKYNTVDPILLKKALISGLERLIAAESEITRFDTIIGDGDCGTVLKRGAISVLKMQESANVSDDALINMVRLVQTIEATMDGTSGAIYAIFLNALVHNLRLQNPENPSPVTSKIWSKALQGSLETLGRYTPAKPGDRTLLDALYPFITTFQETGNLKEAAQAATRGSDRTRGMKPSLGRSVYVGGDEYQKVPDPGAYGLSEFLIGLQEVL